MTKDENVLEENDGPWYYEMHEVGYNYRITDFQCALGSSQLKNLNNFVERRCEIAKLYDGLFSDIDYLKIPKNKNSVQHSYHLYPLQIHFDKLKKNKSELFKKMKESGINLQVHYVPIHLQPFYQKNYGFKRGNFPVAERFYTNEVSLPIYPNLKINDQKYVIDHIKKILNV